VRRLSGRELNQFMEGLAMDNRGNLPENKTQTNDDETVDRCVMAGSQDVVMGLNDVRRELGGPAAMGYAGGMVAGLRAWLVTNHGMESTRELFLRMADDADLCEPQAGAVLQ
jgi:hypothetical protein